MTVEQYKRYCGPAAVASVYGASRQEAAELLEETPTRKRSKRRSYTSIYAIGEALGLDVEITYLPQKEITARKTRGMTGAVANFPTLAQWLRENPEGEAVLRASSHFVHVKDGEVVEDNRWTPMRGRVTHCIWIER